MNTCSISKFWIIILFVMLPHSGLVAQTADEMAKQIETMYRSGKATSISFVLDGAKSSITFASGTQMFRIDMANDLIVSDGITIWHYGKKNKEVAIDKVAGKGGSLGNAEEIIKLSENYSGVLSHKGNLYELQLTPLSSISKFMSVLGDISQFTFSFTRSTTSTIQIKKITAKSAEQYITIRGIKIKPLNKIDPTLFTFTAPAGAKIIDLRD